MSAAPPPHQPFILAVGCPAGCLNGLVDAIVGGDAAPARARAGAATRSGSSSRSWHITTKYYTADVAFRLRVLPVEDAPAAAGADGERRRDRSTKGCCVAAQLRPAMSAGLPGCDLAGYDAH